MDIDGGASIVGSDGGGGTAAWSVTSGGGMLTGWTAGACIEGVSPLSGAWVNGTQGFRSTVSPYPGGGLDLPAKVIDSAIGENTMAVVPEVRNVPASVSVLVCGDSVGPSCVDRLCRDANQETKCGIPYQDKRKIDLGLINASDTLIFENYVMYA
ncbi:hypothetical protein CDL15_Pgr018784 [Punica granatum]|uniref:Uncharacterized protein n=1 Tax=Punica granatum TaxID=22663 RepID=A0A218VV64_PUNGR|nr:hypothetical protein CDL15_Pgr018784 [Punica granatum]